MAYNYFPATYQPNFYSNNPYWQTQQMQMQMPTQQPAQMPGAGQQAQAQQPTIQQSGFVLVQSEQDARAYPVAPGNSITFKDELRPYCYVKTMGFSSLDRPVFEKYRLVKEEEQQAAEASQPERQAVAYALQEDLDAVKRDLDAVRSELRTVLAGTKTEVTSHADE